MRSRPWRPPQESSRTGASGSRSGSRWPPGSAAAAPTRRPRCGSPTRPCPSPSSRERLHTIAARLGADVPFFLEEGSQLATGDGSELAPLDLPHDYVVLLVLPAGESKESTAAVYRRFDERGGADGFDERRARLLAALAEVERASDFAKLPKNDLASSPLAAELERLGAFRADVSGAGPAVYGLFEREPVAARAAATLVRAGQTWIVRPLAGARNAGG